MPKLSIIVPVYNVGKLLQRCLESIVNQSFKDIEIIVINDASTDDFSDNIFPYKELPQIKIIHNDNNYGLGYSRNIGITIARGEYITFVDSDDWVDLDMYKIMIESNEYAQSDIVICSVKNEYNNYISSENRYTYTYNNILTQEKALRLLTRYDSNNYMISPVVWNKLYKHSLIKNNNISFLNNSFWEDDVFSYQVFACCNNVNIVPNVYYHYYQREKSITKNFSKKHIDDLIYAFIGLRTYLKELNIWNNSQEYYMAYLDRAISSMFQMLFNNEPSIEIQKQYVIYFYEEFVKYFSVSAALSYLDIQRFKKLFK